MTVRHSTRRHCLMAMAACAVAAGARASGAGPELPARLPGARQRDLADPASDRVWRIWWQVPDAPAPAGGYPLLCLLDGNAAFALAAQLARNHDARPLPMRGDPVAVLGIGHPADAPYTQAWRQRDFTPPGPGQRALPNRGGADLLLDFIAREALPRVQAVVPIDAQRQTLFGHSFGGLLALHALLTRPECFSRYATASPSIWWQSAQILREVDGFFERRARGGAGASLRLQLRVGGLETAAAAATSERAASQRERRMIENARALAERLLSRPEANLALDFKVLPGLDHGAVMVPALMEALVWAQHP